MELYGTKDPWRDLPVSGMVPWVSGAPGLRVTARHMVETVVAGTRLALSLPYEGLLGRFVARWAGDLNERYLALEADGLATWCSALAAKNQPNEA